MVIDAGIVAGGVFGFAGLLLLAPALIGFINTAVLGFVLQRYEYGAA